MASPARRLLIIAVAWLAAAAPGVCQAFEPELRPGDLSVWQARRELLANLDLVHIEPSSFQFDSLISTTFRLTDAGFEFDSLTWRKKPGRHYSIAFADLHDAKLVCYKGNACHIAIAGTKKLPPSLPRIEWTKSDNNLNCPDWCQAKAILGMTAIKKLVAFYEDKQNLLHDFPAHVAAWRALPVKPPLPEGVRARRLMAEDAMRHQKPAEALKYYQQGMELYPLWPEGWYNAALVSAELEDYALAAEFMQNYLLLSPEAPDAAPARDYLEIWKIKAQEKR